MELENKSTTEEIIIHAEITTGDYNDVYSKGPIVKGTWAQIEEYVKSQFSEDGLKRTEDISSDGYCLAIYQEPTDENGNKIQDEDGIDYEPRIELYVDASPIDEIDEDEIVIDLTKEVSA
jgi:hypothetical protein